MRASKKDSGLNGIQTHELCNTGGMLYQLSTVVSSQVEAGHFVNSP